MRGGRNKNKHKKQLDERLSYLFLFAREQFFSAFMALGVGTQNQTIQNVNKKTMMGPKRQSHCILWAHNVASDRLDWQIFTLNSIEIECNFLWENDTEGQMLYYLLSEDNEAMQSIIISAAFFCCCFCFVLAWSRRTDTHTLTLTHTQFALCIASMRLNYTRITRKSLPTSHVCAINFTTLPAVRVFSLFFPCFSINLIK